MKLNKEYIAYLYLILASSLWGGNVIAAKLASIVSLEPIKLSFYRNLVAVIILTPFIYKKFYQNRQILFKNWKIITFLCFLSGGLFNSCMNISLNTSSVLTSSLMPAFAPAIIIILSYFIFKVQINLYQYLGVIISFIGFVCIIIKGNLVNLSNFNFVIGDLWMFAAVTGWSIYSALLRKLPQTIDINVFLFLIFFIGNIFLLPFFIIESINNQYFFINENNGLLLILYVGIGPGMISFLLWVKSIKIIGPSNSGLFLNLIPVFAGTISIIFLNEILEFYHIIGAILIFIGIYLVNKRIKSS